MQRRNFITLCTSTIAAALSGVKVHGAASSSTVSISLAPSPSTDTSLSRLLQCIAAVETGGDDSKVGLRGERSKYQITYAVWRQHMPHMPKRADWARNCRGAVADALADRHARWLMAQNQNTEVSVYWFAYCWHRGLTGFETDQRTFEFRRGWTPAQDYARRVVNLYGKEYIRNVSRPQPLPAS